MKIPGLKAKTKTKTEVEWIYDRDEQPDVELLAALDAAPAQYRGQPVKQVRDVVREAAVLTWSDNSDRLLLVRPRVIHSIDPNKLMAWLPLARFSEETMGSHRFVVGRRFRAAITDTMFATLEHAFDRAKGTSFAGMIRPDRMVAAPTTVDRQAFVRTRGGSQALHVQWNGLWWSVHRYADQPFRRADEVVREARSDGRGAINYPAVAIV